MEYIIGFDAGTTCFKCALYNTEGIMIAYDSKEYTLLTPRSGYVEYPVESYFEIFASLIKSVTTNGAFENSETSCVVRG